MRLPTLVLPGFLLLNGLALSGCGGGGAAAPSANPGQASSLTLSPSASIVPVGQTVQLTAVAKDENGATVTGLPDPAYQSSDTGLATVNPSGLVTALTAGSVTLSATINAESGTLAATTILTIVATPPNGGNTVQTVGASFAPAAIIIAQGDSVTWAFSGATHNVTFLSAQPLGGNITDQAPGNHATRTFASAGTYDYECTRHSGMSGVIVVQSGAVATYTSLALTPASLALNLGGQGQLDATPQDQDGNAMAGLPAAVFTSDNPAVAAVNPAGQVTALAAGSATITAELVSAGVSHSAVASVTVSVPVPGGVTITTPNLTFSPGNVTVVTGTVVTWEFSGSTHNVTFQGPGPAGGNIPDQRPGASASRTFTVAGSYAYQCTRHNGMQGTITVQGTPDSLPPPPPPPSGPVITMSATKFLPDFIQIAPGEAVTWQFGAGTHNVTFNNLVPNGGNIPDTAPGTSVTRVFTAPGDYDYEDTNTSGMKGRIRVR